MAEAEKNADAKPRKSRRPEPRRGCALPVLPVPTLAGLILAQYGAEAARRLVRALDRLQAGGVAR